MNHASSISLTLKMIDIPVNPVWRRVGISGDCLCLAGTPEGRLVRIAVHYPDVMRRLVEVDGLIQANRRSKEPSYPAPLVKSKLTLSEWYARFSRQATIDEFIEYGSCACMLG